MQKILILIGIIFILVGIFLPWIQRLGLGHLPGDIVIKRENMTFYFPIITCLLLSILLSILLWFLRK
ncbi:DUF2905 domain-containing protein [Aquicella lusitana]|uniref:DUF2905 family protein n=1 Tax=Aquicella lusitana TaxID=254246 RepID=A0A370FY48_9COXI|nr:DUF2905 domain-containing protein [Aquicella lusitana]RDI36462.1 DUF2905 family protein [Aquicella lusitana]